MSFTDERSKFGQIGSLRLPSDILQFKVLRLVQGNVFSVKDISEIYSPVRGHADPGKTTE